MHELFADAILQETSRIKLNYANEGFLHRKNAPRECSDAVRCASERVPLLEQSSISESVLLQSRREFETSTLLHPRNLREHGKDAEWNHLEHFTHKANKLSRIVLRH